MEQTVRLQAAVDTLIARLTSALIICILTVAASVLSAVWWGATVQSTVATNSATISAILADLREARAEAAGLSITTARLEQRLDALNKLLERVDARLDGTRLPPRLPR